MRNARRSRAEIERRQSLKFRKLVAHAVESSPYYRDLVADARIDVSSCHPRDFPELTKAQLMDNFDRIVTDRSITKQAIGDFLARSKNAFELFRGRYYVARTSGTSGTTGYFVYSKQDWTRGMTQALRINPPHFGRHRLAYVALVPGHLVGATFAATCQHWPLSLAYDVAYFDVHESVGAIVEGLNRFRPTILMGYPSALSLLAEQQAGGRLQINPAWIQTSGEPVGTMQQEGIKAAFGKAPTNTYSCTEHLIMGVSKPEFGGMYLLEDDLIFEIGADHTVVTNLFNRTVPLIRYRMSDTLVPQEDRVKAYPFTMVRDIVGRGEVTAIFTNRYGVDEFIQSPVVMGLAAKNVRGIQLYALSKSSCVLRACIEPSLDDVARAAALKGLKDALLAELAKMEITGVHVAVEDVPELVRDPSGKVRAIILPTAAA